VERRDPVTTTEVIAPAETATARGGRVRAAVLCALQLAVAGNFLLTPILAPSGSGDYVPLSFLTVLTGPVTALLAILGGAHVASRWNELRSRPVLALAAGTAACALVFVFTLTPAGRELTTAAALTR
jgi:hypothetical protein